MQKTIPVREITERMAESLISENEKEAIVMEHLRTINGLALASVVPARKH